MTVYAIARQCERGERGVARELGRAFGEDRTRCAQLYRELIEGDPLTALDAIAWKRQHWPLMHPGAYPLAPVPGAVTADEVASIVRTAGCE
jgi:hypothetical protein